MVGKLLLAIPLSLILDLKVGSSSLVRLSPLLKENTPNRKTKAL